MPQTRERGRKEEVCREDCFETSEGVYGVRSGGRRLAIIKVRLKFRRNCRQIIFAMGQQCCGTDLNFRPEREMLTKRYSGLTVF